MRELTTKTRPRAPPQQRNKPLPPAQEPHTPHPQPSYEPHTTATLKPFKAPRERNQSPTTKTQQKSKRALESRRSKIGGARWAWRRTREKQPLKICNSYHQTLNQNRGKGKSPTANGRSAEGRPEGGEKHKGKSEKQTGEGRGSHRARSRDGPPPHKP